MNNFLQRTITGIVFITVIIAAIVYGPVSFSVLFFIVSLLTLWEFYGVVESETVSPQKAGGILIGALLYLSLSPFFSQEIIAIPFAFLYVLSAALFVIELFRKKQFPFLNIAITLTGVIYIVIPFALLNIISTASGSCISRDGGIGGSYSYELPLGFFLLLWSNDTFAYLTGMKLGKHKLFPRISPKKTWEGSIGGLVCSLAVAFAMFKWLGVLSLAGWMAMALIIVVTGTFGDLVESMLKRSVQVKDSGSILPGHGGLLDRFDAMLLAVPFVYIYIMFFQD